MHFNKKVEFIVRFLNCDKINKTNIQHTKGWHPE